MEQSELFRLAMKPGEKVGLQSLIDALQEAKDGVITGTVLLNNKVKYNIEIQGREKKFRLANIEPYFVHAPIENGFHYNDQVATESRRILSETGKRPLMNYFAKYLCQRIEQKFGVTTVEDLQALPDERILSVTMFGKMALQKLRNF